jgi:accessory gene regulator protein AgrB
MTQEIISAAPGEQFGVGKVLSTSAAVLGRNIIPFGFIAIVLAIPTMLLEWFWNPAVNPAAAQLGSTWGYTGLVYLLSIVTNGLVTATLVYGSFQDLRGQKVNIGACFSRGFAALFPIAIAALGYGIAVGFGTLLLIVPGIILSTMFWLYAPAIVVEKKSVGDAFGRSSELTKGKRWHVFGILLTIILLMVIANATFGSFLVGISGSVGIVPILIVTYVVNAVLGAFMSVAATVTYYYLRADKEGIEVEDIAKLFD